MSTLFAPAASQAGSYCGTAGTAGSSAIYYTDPSFIDWASGCEVTRGYQSIAAKTAYATYGTASDAIGTADNAIVSLGDAGSAVLTFDKAVTNGLGYDFVVFENSFSSTFLELAFVEVSSDGTNYFRFDAVSETPTTTPGRLFWKRRSHMSEQSRRKIPSLLRHTLRFRRAGGQVAAARREQRHTRAYRRCRRFNYV